MHNEIWKEHLANNEGRFADGTEPLSFAYCSSQSSVAILPVVGK